MSYCKAEKASVLIPAYFKNAALRQSPEGYRGLLHSLLIRFPNLLGWSKHHNEPTTADLANIIKHGRQGKIV